MRIELHIDRLVTDDLSGWSRGELAAAITRDMRQVLGRDLGRTRAPAAGRVIGAALAQAVTGDRAPHRERGRQ